MSRPIPNSTDSQSDPPSPGSPSAPIAEPSMIRLVCFLRPGEYTNRFERQLTRQGIVILRPRHEMHAFWTILTTEPQALITDIPVTNLQRNYLVNRLASSSKTASMPVIVLGAEDATESVRDIELPGNVRLMEVTTPTRMAELVLDFLRSQGAFNVPPSERQWRADQPDAATRPIVPARRMARTADLGHTIDTTPFAESTDDSTNLLRPHGLAMPRRRMPPPASPHTGIPSSEHPVTEFITPRRVRKAPDILTDHT